MMLAEKVIQTHRGFRAAGAALLSNLSVDRGSVVHWNPETMKLA